MGTVARGLAAVVSLTFVFGVVSVVLTIAAVSALAAITAATLG